MITNFLNLQRYVPYLKEGKAKVQRFINCLPQFYNDKLEYDNPKTMDEEIRRAKLFSWQSKQRSKKTKSQQAKKKERHEQQKKGFEPSPFRNITQNSQGNNFDKGNKQKNTPTQSGTRGTGFTNSKPREFVKEPLKCWGCNMSHLFRNCPYNNNNLKIKQSTTYRKLQLGMILQEAY